MKRQLKSPNSNVQHKAKTLRRQFLERQKFTDEEFLELYRQGYYDVEIAYAFNVNASSVTTRRWRLDLLPNSQISIHTVTNPKQHHKETTHRSAVEHYKSDKEQHKQFQRGYRLTHKEQIQQWGIKYRLPRKEQLRERSKRHYRTHPAWFKKYVQEHLKGRAATQRAYYQRHKEQIRKRDKEHYQIHKEQINERAKEKRRQNRNSFSLEKQTTIP